MTNCDFIFKAETKERLYSGKEMHCLRLTAGVLYIGWQFLICQHVARGRETETIVKCLLRYSCISWYICTLALSLVYLYSLQLLKKKKKKKSSWQTQKDASCVSFLFPAFAYRSQKYQNEGQHRNRAYKKVRPESWDGGRVQQSWAPQGQRERRRGAVSKLTWPAALKTIRSPYFKGSSVMGTHSRIQNLRSVWCWCT